MPMLTRTLTVGRSSTEIPENGRSSGVCTPTSSADEARNESYQGDPTMQPRRLRFTIRGLMIAVFVVAVLMSMPVRDLIFLMLCTTVLAIMFCCAYRFAIMIHG